jgi:hypothetical protein
MSKGKVVVFVVIGAGVLLGGVALAMAGPKPIIRPDLGIAPPPPPPDTLGKALVGAAKNIGEEFVDDIKGKDTKKEFWTKTAVTGGYYAGYKEVVWGAKKVWNSIF